MIFAEMRRGMSKSRHTEAEMIAALKQLEAARGVRRNDLAFGINWPGEVEVISTRDASYPDFAGNSSVARMRIIAFGNRLTLRVKSSPTAEWNTRPAAVPTGAAVALTAINFVVRCQLSNPVDRSQRRSGTL
jgi:hypothetical protein